MSSQPSRSRPPDKHDQWRSEAGPSSDRRDPTPTPTSIAQRSLADLYHNPVTETDKALVKHADSKHMLNQYERGEIVGVGSHGKVYFGMNTLDGERVAIKVVTRRKKSDRYNALRQHKMHLQRQSSHVPVVDAITSTENKIKREIAIMKKLRHPNIVKLIEVIDDREYTNVFMIMEYMEGGEVKWRDEKYRPTLTVNQTMRICRDVVLALDYLHHQGIIHRDIKPGNLLWTADRRRVKVTDFGVSHFSYAQRLTAAKEAGLAAVEEVSQVDLRGVIMDDADLVKLAGTPSFVAPEVIAEVDSSVSSPTGLGTRSRAGSSSLTGNLIPNVNINGLHAELESASSQSHEYRPSETDPSPATTPHRQSVTKAIDVWALGIVLYCLLFGNVPFPAPEDNPTEYAIYQVIRRGVWDVPEFMGIDRVPTGGRHPAPDDMSEGAIVVRLLENLITADVPKRMKLVDMKKYIWLTRDLPDPELWQRETSPYKLPPLVVTNEDTSSALSPVRFRWKVLTRISSVFKKAVRSHPSIESTRSPMSGSSAEGSTLRPWGRSSRHRASEDDFGITSEPMVRQRTQSAGAFLNKGKVKEKATNRPGKKDKGKGKEREHAVQDEDAWQTRSRGSMALAWGRFRPDPKRTQSNLSAATSPGSSDDQNEYREEGRPHSRLSRVGKAVKRSFSRHRGQMSPSRTTKLSWRGRNGNDNDPTSEPEPDTLPLAFDRRSSSSFIPIRATSFTTAMNHHHSDDIASMENETRYGYNPDQLTEEDIIGAGGVLHSSAHPINPAFHQRSSRSMFQAFNGHTSSEAFSGPVASLPAALEQTHPGLFTGSGDVPSLPDPHVLHHINTHGPPYSASRSHGVSPLSQLSYQNLDDAQCGGGSGWPRRLQSRDTWEFSDGDHGDDDIYDDDDDDSAFQRTSDTEERPRRIGGIYDPSPPMSDSDETEDDEEDSVEPPPIEVKRRRPSETLGQERLDEVRRDLGR